MIFLRHLFVLIICLSAATSCRKKEKNTSAHGADERFFKEEATASLSDLKNEMAQGETDLLRSFQHDALPWQRWNKNLKDKARTAQKTIFTLIVSPADHCSRDLGKLLSENDSYYDLFSQNYVCAVADIHANPELALIVYQLCAEIKHQPAFPVLLWMTHEGSPIAWIPIGKSTSDVSEKIISNSHDLIDEMWVKQQSYIIDSNRDSQGRRQTLYDSFTIEPAPSKSAKEAAPLLKRQAIFLEASRRLVSLYDKHDKDLDEIGNLLPSSVINLLAVQAAHPAVSKETQKLSIEAVQGLHESLVRGAMNDGVEGDFFHARRGTGWTFPSFSRNLPSQARLATAFFQSSDLIENDALSQSAEMLLNKLESNWMGENLRYSIVSSKEQDSPDVFLFHYDTLEKLIDPKDFPIAEIFYQLSPKGNISSLNDIQRKYQGINTLAPTHTAADIAKLKKMPVNQVQQALARIQEKIRAKRKENGQFVIESEVSTSDLAYFGLAQIARYRHRPTPENLEQALSTGRTIFNDYSENGENLRHFQHSLPARGHDYSLACRLFLDLYLTSFEPQWLKRAMILMDEAISTLARENFPFMEATEADSVLSFKIHDSFMTFSETSLAHFDHALAILTTLTGKDHYRAQRALIWEAVHRRAQNAPLVHTDILQSSFFSEEPFQIILEGDSTSKRFQKIRTQLNQHKISCYAIIRPALGEHLIPLPELGDYNGPLRLSLTRNNKISGQTNNLSELQKIMEKVMGQKE